jgi:thymidylate synthase
MKRVFDIRCEFVNAYKNGDFVEDKSGCKTVDIIGAQFVADNDHIFGKPDEDYIKRELEWYESKSLNVNDLKNTPKIWKSVADENGIINSNYGWCIYSEDNHDQYSNCLQELRRNPMSRRATMIYNRPSMWHDYATDGRSDFMCTFATQHFIRNGKLLSLVFMRSNDAIFGYKNDYAWQKLVSAKLAQDLGVENGELIWHAGSLHIYESQFYMLDYFNKTSQSMITLKEYKAWLDNEN